MTSSIFGQSPIAMAVGMARSVAGGDPQRAFSQMMQVNPRFREFMQANSGKTPQQVMAEHGIDPSTFGGAA